MRAKVLLAVLGGACLACSGGPPAPADPVPAVTTPDAPPSAGAAEAFVVAIGPFDDTAAAEKELASLRKHAIPEPAGLPKVVAGADLGKSGHWVVVAAPDAEAVASGVLPFYKERFSAKSEVVEARWGAPQAVRAIRVPDLGAATEAVALPRSGAGCDPAAPPLASTKAGKGRQGLLYVPRDGEVCVVARGAGDPCLVVADLAGDVVQIPADPTLQCGEDAIRAGAVAGPARAVVVISVAEETSEDWAFYSNDVTTAAKRHGLRVAVADEAGTVTIAPGWTLDVTPWAEEGVGYVFLEQGQEPLFVAHDMADAVLDAGGEHLGLSLR